MTALPLAFQKTTLDSENDDPKQSRTELANNIDKDNQILEYLSGLLGSDGTPATAREALGLIAANLPEIVAGTETTQRSIAPDILNQAIEALAPAAEDQVARANIMLIVMNDMMQGDADTTELVNGIVQGAADLTVVDGFYNAANSSIDSWYSIPGDYVADGNIVPILTDSNTGKFMTVSMSSVYSSRAASRAVDEDIANSSGEVAQFNGVPGWYNLKFNNGPSTIYEYKLGCGITTATTTPNDWTLEGRLNGGAWNILDTQTNITWTAGVLKTFTFTNTEPYDEYRINVTAGNGSVQIAFWDIQLIGEGYRCFDKVPLMAGPTNGAITVSTKSDYSGSYPGWKAFDNETGPWSSGPLPNWNMVDFGDVVDIAQVRVYGYSDASYSPNTFTFEGSNDGVVWNVLKTVNNQTWTASTWKEWTVTGTFQYFRINITAGNGQSYIAIRQIEWIGATLTEGNLDATTDITEALEAPATGRVYAYLEGGTDADITLQLSNDAGVVYDAGLNLQKVFEIAPLALWTADIELVGATTDMIARCFTSDNADIKLYQLGVLWD